MESLFDKVTGLKRLPHKVSSMILAKLSNGFYKKTPYVIKIAYG